MLLSSTTCSGIARICSCLCWCCSYWVLLVLDTAGIADCCCDDCYCRKRVLLYGRMLSYFKRLNANIDGLIHSWDGLYHYELHCFLLIQLYADCIVCGLHWKIVATLACISSVD